MIFKLDEIDRVVSDLLIPKTCSIFTFEGPLGAGKTTMIKEFLRQKGVTEVVTSPTFAYVNTYQTCLTFHHLDLYRLNSEQDFIDAGFDEYLDGYCLIEWPSVISGILEGYDVCRVVLSYVDDNITDRSVTDRSVNIRNIELL